jgi:hypothetical protein
MADGSRVIELSEGDRFAGYRIERLLGRGGMGVLYLALEPGLERRVALKLIAPEAVADEVFARRFAEESRIAASIEHPNVVPIYAAGEENGVPFIAMRYVSGSDLGKRIARQGRLEPAPAAALIAQVGNGLDAIHAAGLVHRDVKPANVLLAGGGGEEHAYITDFGVARNVATESGLTQTGRFVGTLDYVAPEQISGAGVDARADVYALGCLLFKLLTGEVPFPKDGEAARLYAHLNDPPPAPSLLVPAVPMGVDDVVIRAMSKEPGDRYPSAGDLGRAAVAALSGERPKLPERTVATGAAATAESISPEGPTARATDLVSGEAQTVARDEAALPRNGGDGTPSRRRPVALGAVLALVAAIAAIAVSFGGGEGSDPSGRPERVSPVGDATPEGPTEFRPTAVLGRSQLIARVDEICVDSQSTYLATLQDFPEGEATPDIAYSKILTGISTRAVRRLRSLTPPFALRGPYGRYVAAQERVKTYDRQALEAAEAGDADGYLAARGRRDAKQAERYDLAREVGLKKCSARRE